MNWKNWSYWLKGGIIGAALFVFLTIILIPFGWSGGGGHIGYPNFIIPSLHIFLSILFLALLSGNFGISDSMFIYASLFFGLISYFLVGALIGRIYGKIKSKKQL